MRPRLVSPEHLEPQRAGAGREAKIELCQRPTPRRCLERPWRDRLNRILGDERAVFAPPLVHFKSPIAPAGTRAVNVGRPPGSTATVMKDADLLSTPFAAVSIMATSEPSVGQTAL